MGGPPKKGGPPLALMVGAGVGCLVFVIIIVVIAVALRTTGDSDDDDADDSRSSSTKPTRSSSGDDVMKGAVYKRVPSTTVEVPVPAGWVVAKRSLYSFAFSPDKKAMLAFTTVSSRGEFAGRTQHAWRVFKMRNCTKAPKKSLKIGPDKLPALIVDYECQFNGVPSHVSTVLVNAGRRAFPFVIYAVHKSADARTLKQAKQTILSMRKR
jgi:hypothetical protein